MILIIDVAAAGRSLIVPHIGRHAITSASRLRLRGFICLAVSRPSKAVPVTVRDDGMAQQARRVIRHASLTARQLIFLPMPLDD